MVGKQGVRRETPSRESPRRREEGILPNSAAPEICAYAQGPACEHQQPSDVLVHPDIRTGDGASWDIDKIVAFQKEIGTGSHFA